MITLKSLSEATEQEIFDQVAEHLLKQKEASINENGKCAYRGLNNTMCAAGCLIDDEEYKEEMENKHWEFLVEKGLVPGEHSKFIRQLQRIHDGFPSHLWEEKLKLFAGVHRLYFNEK